MPAHTKLEVKEHTTLRIRSSFLREIEEEAEKSGRNKNRMMELLLELGWEAYNE